MLTRCSPGGSGSSAPATAGPRPSSSTVRSSPRSGSRRPSSRGEAAGRDVPDPAGAWRGLPAVERIGYLAETATAQLAGLRHLVLVDAKAPVTFFAYPGKPGYLAPEGCQVHELAGPGGMRSAR
jgi:hypothetical protein